MFAALNLILNCPGLELTVAVHGVGSYIVEFDMPTYPGLYPSFLVYFLIPKSKGLGAFYKQLAVTTLMGGLTSSFRYLIMGLPKH